jgi:hypothetical protein
MKSTVNRHFSGGSRTRLSASKTTVTNGTAHAVRTCRVLVSVANTGSPCLQTVYAPPLSRQSPVSFGFQ